MVEIHCTKNGRGTASLIMQVSVSYTNLRAHEKREDILITNKLEKLSSNNNFEFLISSIAKDCGYKSMTNLYECKYYKPLISKNLIN